MDASAKKIATSISDISGTNSNIKILVAARWRPEFLREFNTYNSLNLHELTQLDIAKYCIEKLDQPSLRRLIRIPKEFAEIVIEIVSAAEGVFLWVHLVVELILEGCEYYENYPQLKRRLHEYPHDLDKLYHFLLDDVDTRYHEDAAFWLLAVYFFSIHSISTIGFFQLTCEILDTAERFDLNSESSIARLSMNEFSTPETCESLRERMNRQCRHFFQFRPKSKNLGDQRIVFTHRTVLDFLSQRNVISELTALAGERDPVLAVFAAQYICRYGREPSLILPTKELHDLMEVTQRKFSLFPQILDPNKVEKFFKQGLPASRHARRDYDLGHALCFYEATRLQGDLSLSQGGTIFSHENTAYLEAFQRIRPPSKSETGVLLNTFIFEDIQQVTVPERSPEDLVRRIKHSRPYSEVAFGKAWEWTLMGMRAGTLNLKPGYPNDRERYPTHTLSRSVECFLNRGAYPNRLCPAVPEDPDKSRMSLLSMLKRLEAQRDDPHSKILTFLILKVERRGGIEIREEDELTL